MILLGILSTVAALALKYAFHRSRPAWDDPIVMIGSFSFPSGHSMAAGASWLALCLTAVGALRRHRVQRQGAGST